jgi:MFS family permease
MSASAQSFIAFLMWGVGMFIGAMLAGRTAQYYEVSEEAHNWMPIWLWPCALAAAVCLLFIVGGRDVKPEEKEGEQSPPDAEGEPAGE